MRKRIAVVILITLVALPIGATDFVLDLADAGATLPVAPGTEMTFKLRHRLPGAIYTFKIETTGLLDPFDFDVVFGEAADVQAAQDRQTCLNLLQALTGATSEAQLRLEFAKARFASPNAAI